jgi:methylmalonyl-CoA mutase C-terminal domain/subunit
MKAEQKAKKRLRILIAKPGLDGHDKAAKVISLFLRDAGYEVLYTGLHRTVDEIVNTAIQEDVDVIGLSIYSGVHIPITEELMEKLRREGADDIMIVVGGQIPPKDEDRLKKMGVAAVFPVGTRFEEILDFFRKVS